MKSPTSVQREYRLRHRSSIDPPDVKATKQWYEKFTETGNVTFQKQQACCELVIHHWEYHTPRWLKFLLFIWIIQVLQDTDCPRRAEFAVEIFIRVWFSDYSNFRLSHESNMNKMEHSLTGTVIRQHLLEKFPSRLIFALIILHLSFPLRLNQRQSLQN